MTVQSIDISTPDGHAFKASLFANTGAAKAVLLFLPALGTPARFYKRLATVLMERGVDVCIPDWRGAGSSSIRVSRQHNHGYRELLEHDIAAVAACLRERYPARPLWIGGHSLGGQLGLLFAAANSQGIAGVLLVASGTVHLPAYRWPLRAGIRAVLLFSAVSHASLGYFAGHRIGFGQREARGLMTDWGRVARTGRYQPTGSVIDYEARLRELALPVLALTFAGDAWAPKAATQALLDKIASAPGQITHLHRTASETGGHAFNHFTWAKQPEFIAPTIADHMLGAATRLTTDGDIS